MKLTQLATCLLAAAPLIATAGNVFVTPAVSYHGFGETLENAAAPQIGAGYKFANNFGVEATYAQEDSDVGDRVGNPFSAPGTADFKQYHVDGMYFLPWMSNKLSPYIAAGVGELDIKQDGPATGRGDFTQYNAGLGAMLRLTDNLKARLDARYLNWETDKPNFNGVVEGKEIDIDGYKVAAGLTYAFAKKAMPAPMVEAPKMAMPAVETVVPTPVFVPAPMPEPEPIPEPTPMVKAADTCAELSKPVSIPLEVLFDTDKSIVKANFKPELAKVAEFMAMHAKSTAVIEGHTDSRGSNAYNKKLSQARADAIRNALVANFAIDAARITAMGYGEEKPIADNTSAAGLAKNRRVTAVIAAAGGECVTNTP